MRSVINLSTFSPLINGVCKRLRDLCPTFPLPELCPCLAFPTCNCSTYNRQPKLQDSRANICNSTGNWSSQFSQICHLTWFEICPVFSHEMFLRNAPASNWVFQKFDSVWIFFFGRIQNCAFLISRLVGGTHCTIIGNISSASCHRCCCCSQSIDHF